MKNNKGFMLVEVIITSTVILTGMVFLFSSFNSLYAKYKERDSYHNIDASYATKEVINHLMERNLNTFIIDTLYSNESVYLIKNNDCTKYFYDASFCNTIQSLYGIETMIFTTYDKENLLNLRNGKTIQVDDNTTNTLVEGVKNETFKDYIDYVIEYYNIQNENIDATDSDRKNEYTYMILTEINNNGKYSYAHIAIR